MKPKRSVPSKPQTKLRTRSNSTSSHHQASSSVRRSTRAVRTRVSALYDDGEDETDELDELDSEQDIPSAPPSIDPVDSEPPDEESDFDNASLDTQLHADLIDLNSVPKPFKTPAFRSRLKPFKSAKHLLSSQANLAAELDAKHLAFVPDDTKKLVKSSLPKYYPDWMNVRAPPSTRPLRKFCDITGLPANYTDPITGLHYFDSTVYQHIKSLPQARIQKCWGFGIKSSSSNCYYLMIYMHLAKLGG